LPIDLFFSTAIFPNHQNAVTRPDIVPGVPSYLHEHDAPGGRIVNFAAFTAPAGTGVGDTPRNLLRDFGAWQTDLAIRREFPIGERWKLQFRAESFNVFNHPNFSDINTSLQDGPTLFGRAQTTLNNQLGGLNALYQVGGPRSLQLALKLVF